MSDTFRSLADVGAWLSTEYGARPFELDPVTDESLDAEGLVDRDKVAAVLAVEGDVVRDTLATPTELEHLCPDTDEELEESARGWDADAVANARFQQRLERAELAVVVLERDADDPEALGGYQVLGPAQRLRERIWAVTGVVPRDRGAVGSAEFAAAWAAAHDATR